MTKRKTLLHFFATLIAEVSLMSCDGGSRRDADIFGQHAMQLAEDVFTGFRMSDTPDGRMLFYETYPHRGEDRVAYLWATSSVFSGMNALYKATSSEECLSVIEDMVLPMVECYHDTLRVPHGYQSYPVAYGASDRYYDDNTWLGLEFLNLYELTGDERYLSKAESIWEFVASGHDDVLGGGVYWCEQKKFTKNTCSNAPVSVFSARLYSHTSGERYIVAAKELYAWTKDNLKDTEDGLYFDNVHLDGDVEKAKYAYNSGQMMQAASLLYKITGEQMYLDDALGLGEACGCGFFIDAGNDMRSSRRQLRNGNVWFAAVMLRGYEELYRIDGNPEYIRDIASTVKRLWEEGRDKNGLFANNRLGEPSPYEKDDRWLLTQTALIEMYARLSCIEY